jgi:16S rRNA (guanine1516-N2)-methyltransferase
MRRSELVIDFVGGAIGYRFRSNGGRTHPLAKAAGLTKGNAPDVIDATAGLGRDAYLLASMGARVTLLERNAAVYALLQEGLAKASAADPDIAAVVARTTLIHGDAKELLPSLHADVVLVDPMHPPRGNTALVKQEMRLLRELVGPDPDALELMQTALSSAGKRVVLKWPLRAAPLAGLPKPTYSMIGKTVRYDVFVTQPRSSKASPSARSFRRNLRGCIC